MNTNSVESSETSLFLVLEGGGAKGIAHAAAWELLEPLISKPMEELPPTYGTDQSAERYQLTGVAGTSAGAIMAALIAAGAKPCDLFDKEGGLPLCKALKIERMQDIFSVKEWRRLKNLRRSQKLSRLLSFDIRRIDPGSAPRSTHQPNLDIYLVILGVLTVLGTFYFWLDDARVFEKKAAEAIVLILLWVVHLLLSSVLGALLELIEKLYRNVLQKHFPTWLRALFHPLTIFVLSGYLTTKLVIFLNSFEAVQAFYLKTVARNIFLDFWGYGVLRVPVAVPLYAVAGLLAGISIVGALRSFVKGTVRTDRIQKDLDGALRTVLTRRWDEAKGVWVAREPSKRGTRSQLQRQKAMFERFAAEPNRPVTFQDLADGTNIDLSVVTADVIGNGVKVYSTKENAKMTVAQAVAASLAIPFAFRNIQIGDSILLDGGLVSSIPAWVYRRHRTRDPDARILAIGIEPRFFDVWVPRFIEQRRNSMQWWKSRYLGFLGKVVGILRYPFAALMWPQRLFVNVVSTTAFGGRDLDLDASDRLDYIPAETEFELLDFDREAQEARLEIENVKRKILPHISNKLWGRREAFERLCAFIEARLRRSMDASTRMKRSARIRMFWAERDGNTDAVRIKHAYKFRKRELDDRLVLPYRSSMTAWAAETRRTQYGTHEILNEMFKGRMNRYREVVKWRGRRWCWAIPVFEEGNRQGRLAGVLAIESNKEFDLFGEELADIADARSRLWITEKGDFRRDEDDEIVPPPPLPDDDPMSRLEQLLQDAAAKLFVDIQPKARSKKIS